MCYEVFDILKNKIKNIKNNNNYKYANINKNNYSNYSSNNNSNIREYGKQIYSSNSSYFKSYKTESNYKTNNNSFQTFKNPNTNTNSYSTRKEVIQYSTYRNTPLKPTQKDNSFLTKTIYLPVTTVPTTPSIKRKKLTKINIEVLRLPE